jgi:hypothetical protein
MFTGFKKSTANWPVFVKTGPNWFRWFIKNRLVGIKKIQNLGSFEKKNILKIGRLTGETDRNLNFE